METIEQIAKKHNLKVIYDAAHAFGVTYKGRGIGSFGDVSCFSFHATKPFHSIEGGAVCFRDKEFGLELYRLKNFGIRGPEIVDGIGANAKMNEFCAAMGICNLRHIKNVIEKRKCLTERYRTHLEEIPGIMLRPVQEDVESNYAYFPILFNERVFGVNRDEVQKKLEENGIVSRKYFYPLTSDFNCYRGRFDSTMTPIAAKVAMNILTLPLYADLEMEDVDLICERILQCRKK